MDLYNCIVNHNDESECVACTHYCIEQCQCIAKIENVFRRKIIFDKAKKREYNKNDIVEITSCAFDH